MAKFFLKQSAKAHGALVKFLLKQNLMGMEISKRYSSSSFCSMTAKLHVDIGCHFSCQSAKF